MKIIVMLVSLISFSSVGQIKPLAADPTQPKISGLQQSNQGDSQLTDWELQAVNISESSRNAIINGRLVTEGQQLNAITRVKDITINRVVLDEQGAEQILRLHYQNIKQESENSNEN